MRKRILEFLIWKWFPNLTIKEKESPYIVSKDTVDNSISMIFMRLNEIDQELKVMNENQEKHILWVNAFLRPTEKKELILKEVKIYNSMVDNLIDQIQISKSLLKDQHIKVTEIIEKLTKKEE